MSAMTDVQKLGDAMRRHYSYVDKLQNSETQLRLNAARAKKFTADIAGMTIDGEEGAIELQTVVEEGSWTVVP